jgi:hypothetical protein
MREDGQQYAIDHATVAPDSFVCHVRLGPCDGPRISRVVPLRGAPTHHNPASGLDTCHALG